MHKLILILPATILMTVSTSHAQGRPSLTEEQKTCLEGKIDLSGEKPSREKMKQAFEACGVEAPKQGRDGGGPGPQGKGPGHILTDEQRACLDGKVGSAQSGNRPSRDEMKAAMDACGIAKPEKRPRNDEAVSAEDLKSLTERYAQSESDEERRELREEIREVFYNTQDEALKNKVRAFLKENAPVVVQSSRKARTTAGIK